MQPPPRSRLKFILNDSSSNTPFLLVASHFHQLYRVCTLTDPCRLGRPPRFKENFLSPRFAVRSRDSFFSFFNDYPLSGGPELAGPCSCFLQNLYPCPGASLVSLCGEHDGTICCLDGLVCVFVFVCVREGRGGGKGRDGIRKKERNERRVTSRKNFMGTLLLA